MPLPITTGWLYTVLNGGKKQNIGILNLLEIWILELRRIF